jgi:nudix-type nucleoside diphosphatase (YffH/AdpP family)
MALFLFGTLRHPPLLRAVLAEESRATTRPARLAGHAVRQAAGEVFPLLVPAPGETAEGLLLENASAEDLARLDFYEAMFGYDRQAITVDTDRGAAAADVYVPRPGRWSAGGPWDLALWAQGWGAPTLRAAGEVLARAGHVSPDAAGRDHPAAMTRASAWVRARAEAARPDDPAPGDVEVLARRRPYTSFFAVEEEDLRFRRFDGSHSAPVTRAAFVMADAVTVLPYDPVRDRVLLVEQFRFGPHARGDRRPWLLEPIAGRVDAGEEPEPAIRREAREEAGLELGRLEWIGHYYPSPGAVTEYVFTYAGLADLPDSAAGVGGAEAEHEDIRAHVLPFEALMRLVETGEARSGPLLISALWLAGNRARLRGLA